jgi:para-nitrobenzyl esterase
MALTTKTTLGLVQGAEAGGGIVAFRGIPFAAPPVGPLRFRAPVRAEAWSGTRDASRFGAVVPQASSPGVFGELFDPVNPQGSDCLNLNVWTPDIGAVGLPVFVWIHGGAFVIGSGGDSIYDGASFARDGVVTVTINYRLGAAGFHHPGDDVPGAGNFGILDQIAALEWVQENIASFGGDPSRVTVAGESAGAMSVGCLLGAPAAVGLFRRAIPQSGAAHQTLSAASARLVAAELEAALGVDPADATDQQILDAQRTIGDAIRLTRDAARFGPEVAASGMAWQPVAGGDVLPERPIDAIAAGSAKDVDVLVGSTKDEFMLFLGAAPELMGLGLDEGVVKAMYGLTFGARSDEAFERYRANRPGATAVELLAALETDRMFRIPGVRLAEAQAANGARAFAYRFDWESPAFGGAIKAGHAVELPFTWDNVGDVMARRLVGDEAPQALADEVHGAWVRFIADGDPGWARYDAASRTTRLFGGAAALAGDPAGDERELWDGVL